MAASSKGRGGAAGFRPRLFAPHGTTAGLAPGTPVHAGPRGSGPALITVFEYDEERCSERRLAGVEECAALKDASGMIWINIDGVHDVSVVQRIGEIYGIHPLVQEDIVSPAQRPKIESYGEYLFLILKMLWQAPGDDGVQAEQVSLILRPNMVISFQERPGDVFEPVRQRLRQHTGRVRSRGSDYLAYCLVDAVVDHYFVIVEGLEERIGPLEEEVVRDPGPEAMYATQALKRELIFLRGSLWPLRETLARLEREGSALFMPDTMPFLRDVHDHTIQIVEILDSFQQVASSIMDIYMTSITSRSNNIMKVLTIIATIFIPLTFITGVYGMNFHYMPELSWHWGYFTVLGVMTLVVVAQIIIFRRRKWM